jgi:hypothetical protein
MLLLPIVEADCMVMVPRTLDLPCMEGCMEAMLSTSLHLHYFPRGKYQDLQAAGEKCGDTEYMGLTSKFRSGLE